MMKHPTKISRAAFPLSASLLIALILGAGSGKALANPAGATVIHGQVTFSQQGNVFTITNTPNAIINWSSFSIQPGELTRFIQESSNSAVLNRVTGQDPSRILGALQSNGRVFLINPNGILFGRNSQVNVAGLVASSLAISNTDFLAGKNKFTAGDMAGKVSNLGAITTPAGGQVFLIAPEVGNSGIITSPQGDVVLAAGHSVQLADTANPDMHVVISAASDQALNLGSIVAQGGKIGIYAALINQRGTLNANSAVVGENGKIILKANRTTLLEAGSTTTATGAGTGGKIQVLGEQVGLIGDARVDANGQNGGGTVLIGGDYQGKNAAIMNAQQVYVGQDAKISADAIASGNGGKLIVWGSRTAQVYGSLSARGGALSGHGGFIETSGHYLDIAGIRIDARAIHGQNGQWLLDPTNITIASGVDNSPLVNSATFASLAFNGSADSFLNSAQLSNANANVILQATHDINFLDAINVTAAGIGLTAQAGNDINIDASITTNGGAMVFSANNNGGGTASGSGKVNVSGGSVLSGGAVTLSDSTTTPPPTADICSIAPNSALCQVLSPPTASEPVKPVQQASNEVIRTIIAAAPTRVSATNLAQASTPGATNDTSSVDEKTPTNNDNKGASASGSASSQESGSKNDQIKKTFCN
jgi:filamentous hemagglutinin family protein